jgi:hypothetical protein
MRNNVNIDAERFVKRIEMCAKKGSIYSRYALFSGILDGQILLFDPAAGGGNSHMNILGNQEIIKKRRELLEEASLQGIGEASLKEAHQKFFRPHFGTEAAPVILEYCLECY